MTDGIQKAVEAVGSQAKLAEMLGLQRQQVHSWVAGAELVPVKHVRKIEEATGVKREALRPDVYS